MITLFINISSYPYKINDIWYKDGNRVGRRKSDLLNSTIACGTIGRLHSISFIESEEYL